MKKRLILLAVLCTFPFSVYAADLVEVYRQALISDPIFQQAIAQRLSTKQNVPISVAAILPQANIEAIPSITRTTLSGSKLQVDPNTGQLAVGNSTTKAYSLTLTVTQTIFNFAQFAGIAGAMATSKGADATLNAALQNLMIRVANAYFAILQAEDDVSNFEAAKLAYAEQLDQAKQQYNVGLKTITDVYTAEAAYESASANYITAQTVLNNNRENLRAITGIYYTHLSALSERFPLLTPAPANVETWVKLSQAQNWNIRAAQHAVDAARQVIHQQFAGHLPTVTAVGTLDKQYTNINSDVENPLLNNGPGVQVDRTIALDIIVPVFSGGAVVAQTRQASFNYEVTEQQLEQTIRDTINTTRQSYVGIIAGKVKIEADKQAIKSSISSLEGIRESYRVGTETLVDVLNQQQKVLQAQTQYAIDRYAFVNNVLALKQSAGTLSFDDLCAINAWLINKPKAKLARPEHHLPTYAVSMTPIAAKKEIKKVV